MRPKKKNPLRYLLYLLIFVFVIIAFGKWYLGFLETPIDKNAETKAFVVQKGESVTEIANRLEEEGFIRSAQVFRLVFRTTGDPQGIEAGTYKISAAMTVADLIKAMSAGSVDKWVTLLEGWRVEEIAIKINKDLGIDKNEFLKYAKEGYMFPDTYLFNSEASAETIASTMKNTFNQRYDEEIQAKIKTKGLTAEQGVILASLVEREARSDAVRTQVASIILKRFKMGMKLDIDATVRYALDSETLKRGQMPNQFWGAITQADYSGVKSPYNTYLNNGLPPAPICNPSLSSLKAVAEANPATPYLFYYHDSKGNSYYAKTLEEHNENVANHR